MQTINISKILYKNLSFASTKQVVPAQLYETLEC